MDYTVVVVDDDPIILRAVREILKTEDMKVVLLNSGRVLLDYIEDNTPDMILLDITISILYNISNASSPSPKCSSAYFVRR